MPYDSTEDPLAASAREKSDFGRSSRDVTPADGSDNVEPYARVVCLTTGNISVIPVKNADAVTIDFVGVPAGYVVPFYVRRVLSTGTTATVATIDT
jgi:hypothetical protein